MNMNTILKEGPRALHRFKQFETTETDDFVGTMTEPYNTIGRNVRVRPRSDNLAAPTRSSYTASRRSSYPASRMDPRLEKSGDDIYMVSVEDPYKISRIRQTMPHKTDVLSMTEKNKHAILILEPDMDSHIGRHVRSRYIYTGDIPTSTGGVATFERDLYTASEPDPLVTPSEDQFTPSKIAKALPSDASVTYGKAQHSQSTQSLSPTSDPYTASSVSPERHSGKFVPVGRDWPMFTEQAQHMSSEPTHTSPTYTERVRSSGKFYMPTETDDMTASGEDPSVTYMIDPDMLIPDNDILDTSRREINSPSSNAYIRSQINPVTSYENDKLRFSGRHHYALSKAMVSRELPHQAPNYFDRELLSDRFTPYGSARMNALPLYTGDKPIFTGEKPIFTGDKPIYMGDKTIYMGDKPIHMGDKSIFTGEKPIYMGDQPYFKVSQSPFTVPAFNRDYDDSRLLADSELRQNEEERFETARDSRITNYHKQKQHLNSKRMTLHKQPFQRMSDVTGEIGVNKRMTPFHRYYNYRYFTPTATKRRRRIVRTRYGYTLMYFDEHGPLDTLASGLIG